MNAQAILVLDDDPDVGMAAKLLLQRRFHAVEVFQTPQALLTRLSHGPAALLLLDMNFSAGRSTGEEGLGVLAQVRQLPNAPAVIVMTAYADIDLAVRALKGGAQDFITKPWDNHKLMATVAASLQPAQASAKPITASPRAADLLLGESAPMQSLRQMIANVAPTDANVLVLGENGVGKELVARALHAQSARAQKEFLAVDMGAMPDSMFESEMFGHRKGSFTDARQDRAGRFVAAHQGTLFLDEIGNTSLSNQAKLLTALERREVTPLGADRPQAIDVRIISATNLDERSLFDAQTFRPDLLYRLNTIVLRVPPLREHRSDILPLCEHFLQHYAQQYGKANKPLSLDASQALQEHGWPGNVRALRHACERAVILSSAAQWQAADFCLAAGAALPAERGVNPASKLNGDCAQAPSPKLLERERAAVLEAMQAAQGNISQAAKILGLSRAALYRRLDKHGL